MKTIYINPITKDVEFDGSNNLKTVEGDDELLQRLRIRLLVNKNEWFLDPEFGLDRQVLIGKNVDHSIATEILYATILEDELISSIADIKFNYNKNERSLTIDFALIKKDGETLEGSVSV